MSRALVDTGPLVAVLSRGDQHHTACVEQLRSLRPPLVTTWAVLTEAAWLLRKDAKAVRKLFEAGEKGLFVLPEIGIEALPWLGDFLHRYRKQLAQLADATLVYLAERERIDEIFTLDRRDFSIYRFGGNRTFRLLPE